MYPHLSDQLVTQHQTEMRTDARRAHLPNWVRRSHPIRRRTGYALVSIGLRLASTAGED